MTPAPAKTTFGVGLDLGQASDFCALSAAEQHPAPPSASGRRKWRYEVRHLERFDLGTPYPEVVALVKARVSHPLLRGCRVALDYTGVGRPVYDVLKAAAVPARVVPVLIHGGANVSQDPKTGGYHVPKRDLVANLLVLLQAGLVAYDPGLPLRSRLEKELADFRLHQSRAGAESFGAEGSGQHDDLVLSLALNLWLLERLGSVPPLTPAAVAVGPPSPLAAGRPAGPKPAAGFFPDPSLNWD